jgi:hypothetical protein
MQAMIRERCKIGSAIAPSSTPPVLFDLTEMPRLQRAFAKKNRINLTRPQPAL